MYFPPSTEQGTFAMSIISIHAARAIIATALLGVCLQTNAAEPTRGGMDRTEAELRTVLSYELADVKSRDDLAMHLRRAGRDSPLNALSLAARERFLDSLAFNEKGLTGYRYDDLQRELTVTQASRILRLFGAGESAPFLRAMRARDARSEEHTSELQSLMRNSYAVFCL